jgi:hypothetical protein
MASNRLDEIAGLLRSHFDEEAQAGFAGLSRTPSTGIVKLLDYIGSLTETDRDSLLDTLARFGAWSFCPPLFTPDRYEKLRDAAPMKPPFGSSRSDFRDAVYGCNRSRST